MIGWEDIYKVAAAMAPLYAALLLGYGSMKWWRLFTPDQCDVINRFNYYFIVPFFTFHFTANADPFAFNYPFIGADAVSKLVTTAALVAWVNCCGGGPTKSNNGGGGEKLGRCITGFSLFTLNNTLVVGVPLMTAMYGQAAADLVVQASVVQSMVWFLALLVALEARRTRMELAAAGRDPEGGDCESDPPSTVVDRPRVWSLVKVVWLKLTANPNIYACVLGMVWALLSNRFHFQMPSIMEGCILIMSNAGAGIAMFSMGLFMALQEKLIACGFGLSVMGMVLRFIGGPATMAIGALALGLHGDILRIAIIQAALPQSIASFVFANEYGLHANVLSTAVIFGTIVSLPVLVAYYALLELLH